MKLAVMQPYLFPYIGYLQLIYASDQFLVYDDVNYIKQGYINRNMLLAQNGPVRFTVPVPGASSYKLISELQFSADVTKVLKTIEQSYSRAPYFKQVFSMLAEVLKNEDRSIASVCMKGYETIFSYLGIQKQLKKTSELEYDRTAPAQDRLFELCSLFQADCYINSPGGRSLYSKLDFSEKGIELKFIDSLAAEYQQGRSKFVSNLSIIDVLMNCSLEEVMSLIKQYELD